MKSSQDKIRQLKAENKELMTMLRENERVLNQRVRDHKSESDKFCQLFV